MQHAQTIEDNLFGIIPGIKGKRSRFSGFTARIVSRVFRTMRQEIELVRP